MSTIKSLIILFVLLILLGVMYIFRSAFSITPDSIVPKPDTNDAIACTLDAMMCSDGTVVGRSGPDCRFVCPISSSTSTPQLGSIDEHFAIRLNESRVIDGVTIKVSSVIQDSRCPTDVQCIQAGKVVASVNISSLEGAITKELEPRMSLTTDNLDITLDEVTPYPISTRRIEDKDYQFVFTIKSK